VLDGGDDDLPGVFSHAEEGQVVGLGGAGGEDDLGRPGADQFGDGLARFVDRLHGPPTGGVFAVGVAGPGRVEPRQHGGSDLGIKGRARQVIQVDQSAIGVHRQ
jgi:hypothetical protein